MIAKTIKQHDDLEPKKLFSALGNDPVFNKAIKDAFDFSKDFVFFAVGESATVGQVLREMVATGDKQHRRALVFAEGKNHEPAKLALLSHLYPPPQCAPHLTLCSTQPCLHGFPVLNYWADRCPQEQPWPWRQYLDYW